MQLICDEMLRRLGRWLRAAGYDTLIIEENMPDQAVLEIAKNTNRLLITRDQALAKTPKAKEIVILLKSNLLEDCIHELSKKLPINWLQAPFTRCLICNSALVDAPQEALKDVPDDVKERGSYYKFCQTCHKVYWEGSHTKRMHDKLNSFQFDRRNG